MSKYCDSPFFLHTDLVNRMHSALYKSKQASLLQNIQYCLNAMLDLEIFKNSKISRLANMQTVQ